MNGCTHMTRDFRYLVILVATAVLIVGGQYAFGQASAADSSTGFVPLDQWKAAIIAGDAPGLKALYSTDPAARVEANGVAGGADSDIDFWLRLKARSAATNLLFRLQPNSPTRPSPPALPLPDRSFAVERGASPPVQR